MAEWREIAGSKGIYWISSEGQLKTLNHYNSGREAIMKPALNHKGYLFTSIKLNGKVKKVWLHRLVAGAFISNPECKPQVNHRDFNKVNNCVGNLEWVTAKENFDYSLKAGHLTGFQGNIGKTSNLKVLRGESIGTHKLSEREVLEIRSKFVARKVTRLTLAEEYNVKPATIKDIVLRRSWRHLK